MPVMMSHCECEAFPLRVEEFVKTVALVKCDISLLVNQN